MNKADRLAFHTLCLQGLSFKSSSWQKFVVYDIVGLKRARKLCLYKSIGFVTIRLSSNSASLVC